MIGRASEPVSEQIIEPFCPLTGLTLLTRQSIGSRSIDQLLGRSVGQSVSQSVGRSVSQSDKSDRKPVILAAISSTNKQQHNTLPLSQEQRWSIVRSFVLLSQRPSFCSFGRAQVGHKTHDDRSLTQPGWPSVRPSVRSSVRQSITQSSRQLILDYACCWACLAAAVS